MKLGATHCIRARLLQLRIRRGSERCKLEDPLNEGYIQHVLGSLTPHRDRYLQKEEDTVANHSYSRIGPGSQNW